MAQPAGDRRRALYEAYQRVPAHQHAEIIRGCTQPKACSIVGWSIRSQGRWKHTRIPSPADGAKCAFIKATSASESRPLKRSSSSSQLSGAHRAVNAASRPNLMNHDDYADRYRRNRSALPWILEPLRDAVALLATGACVAEVGCGTGNYSIALSETRGDVRFFGFDISKAMLEQARQRPSSVEFAEGDANACFPYPEQFADLSFCVDVLHHVTDHAAMFRELGRVLSPGCSFIAVTDSSADIDERSLTRFFPETRAIELSRYPSLDSLTSLAHQEGFALTERLSLCAEREIDAELLRQLDEKSASALRLIDDAAHARGMQRATLASQSGARWLSRYTLLRFVR